MNFLRADFNKNPYVGLFARCNNTLCLVGKRAPEEFKKVLREALQVDIVEVSVDGSDLVGLLSVIAKDKILLPFFALEEEAREISEKTGMDVIVLNDRRSALGNNMVFWKDVALLNPNLKKETVKAIKDLLDVEVYQRALGPFEVVGSVMVLNKNGILASPKIPEEDLEFLEEIFGLEVHIGTANFGSDFLGTCIIANDRGVVVGEETSGIELLRISEALGD